MTGKRQHYVPRFVLRRFAIDPQDKKSMIFKLDVDTGRPQKVNPINEAVRRYYYRMEKPDGEVDDTADELLDRIESGAGKRLDRLVVDEEAPSDIDAFWIASFIASLKVRTPEGREQLHETDVRMAELMAEVRLSDPEMVSDSVSDEDRKMLLQELRDGHLLFESTPTREVGLMFTGLQHTAEFIASQMRWTLIQAPAGRAFVLSDHPVAHFDPNPKFDGAGWGYASSPDAKTFVPLDPGTVLLLEPADGRALYRYTASSADVDEINLLMYAQAKQAIYGSSQHTVVGVRRFAKRHPRELADFRLRPPRLWVTEANEGDADPIRVFRSSYKGHAIEQELYVPPDALREARENAWEP